MYDILKFVFQLEHYWIYISYMTAVFGNKIYMETWKNTSENIFNLRFDFVLAAIFRPCGVEGKFFT